MSDKVNELAEALRFQTNGRVQDADERNRVIAEKNHQLLQLRDELAIEKSNAEKLREAAGPLAERAPTGDYPGEWNFDSYFGKRVPIRDLLRLKQALAETDKFTPPKPLPTGYSIEPLEEK